MQKAYRRHKALNANTKCKEQLEEGLQWSQNAPRLEPLEERVLMHPHRVEYGPRHEPRQHLITTRLYVNVDTCFV